MSLLRSLLGGLSPRLRADAPGGLSIDDWIGFFTLGEFPANLRQTLVGNQEVVESTFAGLASGAYYGNGIVFACMLARFLPFSEARFQFQQLRAGRPGDLFGTPDLRILENPEPGKTTGDLEARAMIDADLAGNGFVVRRPGRIKRLRPDWTAIVLGSQAKTFEPDDPDNEIIGFSYTPRGIGSGEEARYFGRDEVAHFAPIPDPLAHYRGMSWLTPIIREILADGAATSHKLKFFENAATPNLLMKTPLNDLAKLTEWLEGFRAQHEGVANAYRTIGLGAGMDATVIGTNLQQQEFKVTQGAGETRIAAAARVHPVVVGISEGLAGASLNAGNFAAAARWTADACYRPNWRNLAGALETIVPPPPGSRLWYDDRDIAFLAEDIKVAADVLFVEAQAIRQLVDGGFVPEAVVDAVTSGDLRRLAQQHTGLLPVQLQTPGAGAPAAASARFDFWPVSGDWSSYRVARGELFDPRHPLVSTFPSMFEPVEGPLDRPLRAWTDPVIWKPVVAALAAGPASGGA